MKSLRIIGASRVRAPNVFPLLHHFHFYRRYAAFPRKKPSPRVDGVLSDPFFNEALASLKAQIENKELQFPYESINNIPKASALALLRDFSSELSAIKPDRSRKKLEVVDYIKPKLTALPYIARLIKNNKYPKSFMEIRGFDTRESTLREVLSSLFLQHYKRTLISSLDNTFQAINSWDIQRPENWFPEARKMRRKIVMHVGPTNSGKTHYSLQEFAKAKSGYYAGPLRMLAREVYERFLSQGVNCNLVTGEEIIPSIDEFGVISGLSAGTIEMIPLRKKMDICVIDEIQMIADEQRGCAWTTAVLGVQAKEIHLCGEERSVEIIKKIAEATGDVLEIKRYNRLGKLSVMSSPLKQLSDLQSGDCVVFFSKRKILEMKCKIELMTNLKVGVIYGALPPEVRAQESSRFNSGQYDVLVASDAIGMGINLKIKRIVFGQTTKFNGLEMLPLSPSSIKQIAGRAGRYSHVEGELEGLVTTFKRDELKYVQSVMSQEIAPIRKAAIWPPDEFWMHFVSCFENTEDKRLSTAFNRFSLLIKEQAPRDYFLSDLGTKTPITDFIKARRIDFLLTIDDQLKLSQLPLNLQRMDDAAFSDLHKVIEPIVGKESKTIFDLNFLHLDLLAAEPPSKSDNVNIVERLEVLERDHKLTLVFMWLAQRWPTYFVDKGSASDVKLLLEKRISEELKELRMKNTRPKRQFVQNKRNKQFDLFENFEQKLDADFIEDFTRKFRKNLGFATILN